MKGIAIMRISEPPSHQFSNHFIHWGIHAQMTAENALWVNQYIAVHFFHGSFPHLVSYAKFSLMVLGGESRSVIFVLSFHGGSAAHSYTVEMS